MKASDLLKSLTGKAKAAVLAQLGRKPVGAGAARPRAKIFQNVVRPAMRIDPGLRARWIAMPMRVSNPLNGQQGKWWDVQRVRRERREATTLALLASPGTLPPLPVVVTMTRVARRMVDDDAVPGCLKSVRDAIAEAYGIDDADPRIKFKAEQIRGKTWGVTVEIRHEGTEARRAATAAMPPRPSRPDRIVNGNGVFRGDGSRVVP